MNGRKADDGDRIMQLRDEHLHGRGGDASPLQENLERLNLWDVPQCFPPNRGKLAESGPIRVLLAEDNMIDQVNIRGLLEKRGIEVVCAANGREAVNRYEAGCYDIVMLDILMQEMDGFEAASRIREKELRSDGQTTIIALTAYSLEAVYDKCRSVGMNGYLSKPVSAADLGELFSRLNGGLARKRGGEGGGSAGDLPVLDVNASLTNLGGDRELYRDVVAMFADCAPEIVGGLITALQTGDMTRAEFYSHNLKGMSANIGAKRLAELSRMIHDSIREARIDGRERWIDRIRDEFGCVSAAIASAGEILSP